MTIFTHEILYQEVVCQAGSYRRSCGFEPEFGWVDINREDIGGLAIEAGIIPWRPANGVEASCPLTIDAWFKSFARQTVTTPPKLARPKIGFRLFGDLEFRSFADGKALDQEPMIYRDVYVADSGLEEVTFNLATARLHTEGRLRILLTDIRKFYKGTSPFLQRINVRTRSGAFDERTTKAPGVPWPLVDVVRFLLSQLPGSPILHKNSEFAEKELDLPPPENLVGEGEPVIEVLAKLLERYGLEARFLPDGNYSIDRKGSLRVPYGHIPVQIGVSVEGTFQHYERKTITIEPRPPAVQVIGKRRVRRITLPLVAIYQDTDGRYYPLSTLQKRWGYSIEKLNRQVLVGHEKQFQDVPPIPGGFGQLGGLAAALAGNLLGFLGFGGGGTPGAGGAGSGGKLHFRRREILRKWAYRGYAPAALFEGRESIGDDDFELIHFLPVREAPFYVSELARLSDAAPHDRRGQPGDREGFVLLPPVVRARRMDQTFFDDFKAVEAYFNELIRLDRRSIEEFQAFQEEHRRNLILVGKDLLAEELTAEEAIRRSKENPPVVDLGADVVALLSELGLSAQTGKLAEREMTERSRAALDQAKIWAAMVKRDEQMILDARKAQAETELRFKKYRDAYFALGGVQLQANLPWGVVEQGHYHVDERTGIVLFSEPACHMREPFRLDKEASTVAVDGGVFLTFGYEIRNNVTEDWTSITLIPRDLVGGKGTSPEGFPEVVLAEVNQSSAIKPKIERDPEMRLYEAEHGTPFNLGRCAAQAAAKATGQIALPGTRAGFVYEYSGLRRAVLDSGIDSIQHEFDGMVGRTTIMQNAPNARGPAGPPRLAGTTQTRNVETREAIEASKVE